MKLLDLVNDLEVIFAQDICNNYPEGYDEDHISFCILNDIRRKMAHVEVDIPPGRTSLIWRPWKLKGKAENNFGDIAIMVNIVDRDGVELQGVSFLEAKKKYGKSGRFEAVKKDQLWRIQKNAPHAMLLLYDFEEISDFITYQEPFASFPLMLYRHFMRSEPWTELLPPMPRTTHSVSTPIDLVNQLGVYDRTLYRYSTPLSTQIVFRYFNGFDLEFSAELLAIAKGLHQNISPPKFLLICSIGRDGANPREDIEVNTNLFETFGDRHMTA